MSSSSDGCSTGQRTLQAAESHGQGESGAARRNRRGRTRGAVVGGLAVAARGEPRFTRDVDLALSVERDQDAERLVNAMTHRGYVVDTVIIALKVLAEDEARLQDRLDLRVLARVATTDDWAVAEGAVRLIRPRARVAPSPMAPGVVLRQVNGSAAA